MVLLSEKNLIPPVLMFYRFWLELNCAFLSAVVLLWPKGPQGPITNPLCSLKMPWHQLEYLTGCYSVLHKNTHFSSTSLESDSSSRCGYWVCVSRWWRAEMAEGSELSSLPAHLAPCMGILAHITLRNASSNIFPAGLQHSTYILYTHTLLSKEKRCMPDVYQNCMLLSICPFSWLYVYANVHVCLCVRTCFTAVKDTLIRCTLRSTLINSIIKTQAALLLGLRNRQTVRHTLPLICTRRHTHTLINICIYIRKHIWMHKHKKNNSMHASTVHTEAHRYNYAYWCTQANTNAHHPNTHTQAFLIKAPSIIMRKLHVLLFCMSTKGHVLCM